MKRLLYAVATGLAVFALASGVANADNPHFVNASASVQGSNVAVNFKEAGLGNNVTVTIEASALISATYGCFNGGGNHPKAANKETVTGLVSKSGEFTSGKNGSITGTILLPAPGPGGFMCPNGQRLALMGVTLANGTITDVTNGVTAPIG